jgi:regulator of replication initiation timing
MGKSHKNSEDSKAYRELQKENRRLRAENKMLRRKIIEAERSKEAYEDDLEEKQSAEYSQKENNKKARCPSCREEEKISVMILRGKQYYSCQCGSKGWLNGRPR